MSGHTNCWCQPNILRCSLPGCPRLPRYHAEQKKRQEWAELIQRAQNHVMTDEEIAAQRASWERQDMD